jgi:tetratricopeptide (TPR) repeat protein
MPTKKAAHSKPNKDTEQSKVTHDQAANSKTDSKAQDASKHQDKSDEKLPKGSEGKSDSEILKKLDLLSEALQGGLSDIDPKSALTMIDQWHSLIQKSKEPELKELATSLKDLQKALKRDDATGHDLSELLSHMGEQTNEIASKAEQGLKKPLQQLGKQLTKVGRSLAKAEDQQHLEALDSLVETLAQDPDQIDAKYASEIDQWHALLHESEDESLQAIASDLKALKQLLKGKKIDHDDLSEMLINMGEQTITASSNASRGFKGVIKMLGKSLTRLGESIE